MPEILTSVAFVVCQDNVVDWPRSTVSGFAVRDAVVEAGGGGGGGGGGAVFLWQALRNKIAPSANTRVNHFTVSFFTFSSQDKTICN
jgi:hypothetical protein